MGTASRYWRFIKLEGTGRCKINTIAPAEAFFRRQFATLDETDVPDTVVQRQLMQWRQTEPLAELCLRCFISEQVWQVCLKLESQFGAYHGFTSTDLFPFVLNDLGDDFGKDLGKAVGAARSRSMAPNRYQSFAMEVLQSFDPERSNLSTWTTRLVKCHPEVTAFLLEKGVYLISDWALLNDTTPKQAQRILIEFHQLTQSEVQSACQLLESYHAVYRRDRLQQRQSGVKGQCSPPTPDQLQQMATWLSSHAPRSLPTSSLMASLHALADRLREYRVYVRGGFRPTESLETPDTRSWLDTVPAPDSTAEDEEVTEFLAFYRQQFLVSLQAAMTQVTDDRTRSLQRKDPQKAQQFLTALRLFHCEGKSMGEIAQAIGLQAQYQVTRLLNLKPFRADIRQQLLRSLKERILEHTQRNSGEVEQGATSQKFANAYTNPDRLTNLDSQLEAALSEQLDRLIQEAEAEASTAKRTPTSLFSRQLCQQLDQLDR